jgi:hypothetical protein
MLVCGAGNPAGVSLRRGSTALQTLERLNVLRERFTATHRLPHCYGVVPFSDAWLVSLLR